MDPDPVFGGDEPEALYDRSARTGTPSRFGPETPRRLPGRAAAPVSRVKKAGLVREAVSEHGRLVLCSHFSERRRDEPVGAPGLRLAQRSQLRLSRAPNIYKDRLAFGSHGAEGDVSRFLSLEVRGL